MGATPTGEESGTPSRLVRRSISRTSTRTFCAIARRSRCRRLRRSVASDSLPPSPKFQASRGSRARAARRISGSVANGRGNSFDWAMAQYYTPVRPAESWYTARRAHPSEPREDLVMEIGCHLPTTQAAEAMGEALVTFAREAERQHIASLCVSDHVVIPRVSTGYGRGRSFPHPPERPYLEAVTALAAAAVCTTRARLGSSVFILGHRQPVLMAKMLASIDALSKGRLICGFGVGWWKEELEILGAPQGGRRAQPLVGDDRDFDALRLERRASRPGPAGRRRSALRVQAPRGSPRARRVSPARSRADAGASRTGRGDHSPRRRCGLSS